MPEPPYYACLRGANCCHWPGFVKVSADETKQIAAFLKLDGGRFHPAYHRLRPHREGLALIDNDNGECFAIDCRLQPIKPVQCCGFPDQWNLPDWREVCEVVPVERSAVL